MRVTIDYFAWVREATGRDSEAVDLPDGVTTIGALIGWLHDRGGSGADAFADPARLRAAIGTAMAGQTAPLVAGERVALFPPVTGG